MASTSGSGLWAVVLDVGNGAHCVAAVYDSPGEAEAVLRALPDVAGADWSVVTLADAVAAGCVGAAPLLEGRLACEAEGGALAELQAA